MSTITRDELEALLAAAEAGELSYTLAWDHGGKPCAAAFLCRRRGTIKRRYFHTKFEALRQAIGLESPAVTAMFLDHTGAVFTAWLRTTLGREA